MFRPLPRERYAPVDQSAESAASKSVQCGFESHPGYQTTATGGLYRSGPGSDPVVLSVVRDTLGLMDSRDIRHKALTPIEQGLSLRAISILMGISRAALRDWRDHPEKPRDHPEKLRCHPEKPRCQPEKLRCQPEKPPDQPEKLRCHPEKPRCQPGKPRDQPEQPPDQPEKPRGPPGKATGTTRLADGAARLPALRRGPHACRSHGGTTPIYPACIWAVAV